jgi:hypothetical protein
MADVEITVIIDFETRATKVPIMVIAFKHLPILKNTNTQSVEQLSSLVYFQTFVNIHFLFCQHIHILYQMNTILVLNDFLSLLLGWILRILYLLSFKILQ